MNEEASASAVVAVKDQSNERPIPTEWRAVFREIVGAFAAGDYQLRSSVPYVSEVSEETAAQIQDYIQDYGATLVALPDESWESSVCIRSGSCWEVLVDLWTEEEGRSDLVLSAKVTEAGSAFVFNIHMVYVP